MTIEEALDAILDRWVEWFVNEVELYDDGSYTIPATQTGTVSLRP